MDKLSEKELSEMEEFLSSLDGDFREIERDRSEIEDVNHPEIHEGEEK